MKSAQVEVSNSSDESVDTNISHKLDLDDKGNSQSSSVSYWEFLPYLNFMIPFMAYILIWYFFNRYLVVMILYFYIIVPLFDMALPLDTINWTKEKAKILEKDPKFLIPLYLYWAVENCNYFFGLYWFSFREFNSLFDECIFVITIVLAGAVGMVVAHELIHRREFVHKAFGASIFFKQFYSHFPIEHIKGHHKNVATELDSATAFYNETLYHFVPRSIIGGYKSVWNYEVARLARKREGPWSLNNRVLSSNLAQFCYV